MRVSLNADRSVDGRAASCPAREGCAEVETGVGSSSSRIARWFGSCFFACGRDGLPPHVDYEGARYALVAIFKHDFLAATALYEAPQAGVAPRRIVSKVNRRMHFCLVPLNWLGRLMTRREVRSLRRCQDIQGVPRVLARTGPNSYLYAYIEGRSLDGKPPLPTDFFERLLSVLREIHARDLVHFDLHKRGNILLGDDGRPHIIDFQLATHIGDRLLLSRRLSARLRHWLQGYDIYHLYKHKRRLLPGELTDAEDRLSRDNSLPLRMHRTIARPLKRVRRACLRYLHARGIVTGTQGAAAHVETDPARWRTRRSHA